MFAGIDLVFTEPICDCWPGVGDDPYEWSFWTDSEGGLGLVIECSICGTQYKLPPEKVVAQIVIRGGRYPPNRGEAEALSARLRLVSEFPE